MRRPALLAALAGLLALPATADVPEAVTGHPLPGFAAFAEAAATLDAAARTDCAPEALQPAFHATFDAWMAVSHLTPGPVGDQGLGLAIAFWPDPRGQGQRALDALLAAGDPAALNPGAFADQSVAVRGLFTLERLLYGEPADAARCAVTRAVATDLAATAALVDAGWRDGFAQTLLTAGEPGNARYLTPAEARQALFTARMAGLEFTADSRLGRPLGSFDRPRPERAEAVPSGRSLRNVILGLAALRALAVALVPDSPATQAAFDRARALAEGLDDPVFAGVADPDGRLRVEILQQAVTAIRAAALTEIGGALGVGAGFNSADGD
jgi:predicted lipoprotein